MRRSVYLRSKLANPYCLRRRKQICPNILGPNRVGLRLFVDLALVVSADRHREAEPDDQAQQGERSPLHHPEVRPALFFKLRLPAHPATNPGRQPEQEK